MLKDRMTLTTLTCPKQTAEQQSRHNIQFPPHPRSQHQWKLCLQMLLSAGHQEIRKYLPDSKISRPREMNWWDSTMTIDELRFFLLHQRGKVLHYVTHMRVHLTIHTYTCQHSSTYIRARIQELAICIINQTEDSHWMVNRYVSHEVVHIKTACVISLALWGHSNTLSFFNQWSWQIIWQGSCSLKFDQ